MLHLTLRQLEIFCAVAQAGSTVAAADAVALSQSATSAALQQLEQAMGAQLFERVGRGLQLNAAGERVTGYFRHLRGGMEALNRELQELREGSAGRLAVGSIMAASPGRLSSPIFRAWSPRATARCNMRCCPRSPCWWARWAARHWAR